MDRELPSYESLDATLGGDAARAVAECLNEMVGMMTPAMGDSALDGLMGRATLPSAAEYQQFIARLHQRLVQAHPAIVIYETPKVEGNDAHQQLLGNVMETILGEAPVPAATAAEADDNDKYRGVKQPQAPQFLGLGGLDGLL